MPWLSFSLFSLHKSSTLLTLIGNQSIHDIKGFKISRNRDRFAMQGNLWRQVKQKRPFSLALVFLTCRPIDSNTKNVCDRPNGPNPSSLPAASNINKHYPIKCSKQLFLKSRAYFFYLYKYIDVADLRDHACLSSSSIHPTSKQVAFMEPLTMRYVLYKEVHIHTWWRLGSCFHGALCLNGNSGVRL